MQQLKDLQHVLDVIKQTKAVGLKSRLQTGCVGRIPLTPKVFKKFRGMHEDLLYSCINSQHHMHFVRNKSILSMGMRIRKSN